MRPFGPVSPMRSAGLPLFLFDGGQSDRSGRCPSRVWITVSLADLVAASTRCSGGMTWRSWLDIVAEALAEAARLDEVALHVDDQQRGVLRLEGVYGRVGVDEHARQAWLAPSGSSARWPRGSRDDVA